VIVLVALVKAGEPLYTILRGFLLYVLYHRFELHIKITKE